MITTYWRIPNIFTISQEHKGKTTGNGANFPTLHSNKPEQRSEKTNVETWRRCGLDPQKITKEALVRAPWIYPLAWAVREDGVQRSGISQLHFAAKLCSGLCAEEGGWRSWQYFASPLPSASLVPSKCSGHTRVCPLRGTGTGWALPGLGLSRAQHPQQSHQILSSTCSAEHQETLMVTPRPWTGPEI